MRKQIGRPLLWSFCILVLVVIGGAMLAAAGTGSQSAAPSQAGKSLAPPSDDTYASHWSWGWRDDEDSDEQGDGDDSDEQGDDSDEQGDHDDCDDETSDDEFSDGECDDEGPDVCEVAAFYAVQDDDKALSTVLRFDIFDPFSGMPILELQTLETCGLCDIEALALDADTGRLYGVAGGGSQEAVFPLRGDFFEVDKETGALTFIGNTGAAFERGTEEDEIVSASWRFTDGSIWAFQENVGLLTIDPASGETTLQRALAANWEGLAWNAEGSLLYGTQGPALLRWDPATDMVVTVCADLGGEIEALEFDRVGQLVGSRDGTINPIIIDPADCSTTEMVLPTTGLSDLEALAFDECLDE